MEHGRRLLGALEVAGAALFAAGLAVRTAHRRLMSINQTPTLILRDKIVLIIGSNTTLCKELCNKFLEKGCKVVCSDSTIDSAISLPESVSYVCCDTLQTLQVSWLEKKVSTELGDVDILLYISKDVTKPKAPLDQMADIVSNDLMQTVHVISKFLPNMSTRGGHFIVVEPHGAPVGAFKSAGEALTQLTDTLAQQISYNGTVHTMRVSRRFLRKPNDEDPHESAADIVGALESGLTSITLPSATKHIRNTLRFLLLHCYNIKPLFSLMCKLKFYNQR